MCVPARRVHCFSVVMDLKPYRYEETVSGGMGNTLIIPTFANFPVVFKNPLYKSERQPDSKGKAGETV